MISREEVEQKAEEFEINVANVERDYVFGWVLAGIYQASDLSRELIFKGGNCFRKAYFPATRFSKDLDFATESRVDPEVLRSEIRRVCSYAEERSGVSFDIERTRVEPQQEIDGERTVYDVRVYFRDFYGNPDTCTISISLDVSEFEQIYLPTQERQLIHPYSDADLCRAPLRCLKLEEMLASKLKCMLQREHIADVFDLAYSVLLNRDIAVNRREVVSTFLKKTIFEGSPLTAKQLLLDLPFHSFQELWSRYIICPVQSFFDLGRAETAIREFVEALFVGFAPAFASGFAPAATPTATYFASGIRTTIMSAVSRRHLLRLTYDGLTRLVEPYSLAFKRRQDGVGREYLYVYDLTGGRSGPGVKSLIQSKIQRVEETDQEFEPRYRMDVVGRSDFARRPTFETSARIPVRSRTESRPRRRFTYSCMYCQREFIHVKRNSSLNKHDDGYGNPCYGRRGTLIGEDYY